jgi:hypothetical protein
LKKQWIIIVSLAALLFPSLRAAELVGTISDAVILPPNLNTFNPPRGAGSSYIDPAFGTKITRITDDLSFSQFVLGGYYSNSEICFFNKDGSYFITSEDMLYQGKPAIVTYLYSGSTGARLNMIGAPGTGLEPYFIRWALADHYKVDGKSIPFNPINCFYHYKGNEIRLYDALHTDSYVVIHKFSEYTKIGPAGGEGDISRDGRYWVLDGDDKELFAYDLIDNIKYPVSTFDLGSLGSQGGNIGVDYAAISPSGDYIIVAWGTDPGAGKRYAGIELYDKNWKFIRQLHPSIIHWSTGINSTDGEVIYTVATHDYPEVFASCGAKPGDIISVRLSDGRQRLLKDIPNWAQMTITSCNYVENGDYIYVAYQRRSDDPLTQWAPYWDEIFAVPTDGSQTVRRFVHHRSHYVAGQSTKYYQPDAMVNRQGTRILYRSTYNTGIGDVYMFSTSVEAPDATDHTPPNSPTGLHSGAVDYKSIELVWLSPGSAADGDLPTFYKVYRDQVFLADVFDTRYIDHGLEESSRYTYQVFSVDNSGNISKVPAQAVFSTLADLTPPFVLEIRITDATALEVVYSERVDPASATNMDNYSINTNISLRVAVLAEDGVTLMILTSPMQLGVQYNMSISNVTDVSKNRNPITGGAIYSFALLAGFYDDFEDGIDPAWVFHTPSRWQLASVADNQRLFLNTSDYGDLSSNLLGEYALVTGSERMGSDLTISCLARSNEDEITNNQADYAVIFGFVDDQNYYYVQFHPEDVKLHRVVDGKRTVFEDHPFRSELTDFSRITVELKAGKLRTLVNGQQVFDYALPAAVTGQVGVGSFNDSAWFDNVNVGPSTLLDTTPPNAPRSLNIVDERGN